MQENKPVLIVGLGNPGSEYENTRHNVGFIAIDLLAGSGADWKKEKQALIHSTQIDGRKVIFAKPQTYMNNSGVSVQGLCSFYKIPTENVIVIHDDMDIKLGQKKEKTGGGSAGHNGIKSIDVNIGKDYRRIRIGVGHPRDVGLKIDPADWVLGKFSKEEKAELMEVLKALNIKELF